jgi:protein-tyrosine phosphatase
MNKIIEKEGVKELFFIDSAGTSAYHVGEPADSRSQSVAQQHGYKLTSRSRKVQPADFLRFDLIIAMDQSNLRELQNIAPKDATAQLALCRSFDPQSPPNSDVPDPYYGGEHGFLEVLQICERSCEGILAHFNQSAV